MSAFGRALTIDGGLGADIIFGTDYADVIIGGAGVDDLTGGAGNDTFMVSAASSNDNILDFAAGDIIDFTSAVTIVTNATASAEVASISAAGLASFDAADDTLDEMIAAVANAINQGGNAAAGQAAMFKFGSDSYVFISDGTDGLQSTDTLIKLVGLDVVGNTAVNQIVIDNSGNFTLG
jgi:hypothetical protein